MDHNGSLGFPPPLNPPSFRYQNWRLLGTQHRHMPKYERGTLFFSHIHQNYFTFLKERMKAFSSAREISRFHFIPSCIFLWIHDNPRGRPIQLRNFSFRAKSKDEREWSWFQEAFLHTFLDSYELVGIQLGPMERAEIHGLQNGGSKIEGRSRARENEGDIKEGRKEKDGTLGGILLLNGIRSLRTWAAVL